jgi:hypothetical protein
MATPDVPADIILPEPRDQQEIDLFRSLQDQFNLVNNALNAIGTDSDEKVKAASADPTAGYLDAKVDDVTIQVVANALTSKDGGIDHDALLNTHNLTTDIDHNTITNNHNLTTDIDHDALTNYTVTEHFTMLDEDDLVTDSNTQAATQQSVKKYVDDQIATVGGAWVFVGYNTFTTSGTETITHTFTDGDTYKLILNFTNGATNTWQIRFDSDAGSTYDFGILGEETADYSTITDAKNATSNAAGFTTTSVSRLSAAPMDIGAEFLVRRVGNNVVINGWVNAHEDGAGGASINMMGRYSGSSAADNVQLVMSGNATGNMYLYKTATS